MSTAFSLTGRTVAITGAAGGIGAACAELCAELGADVHLADLVSPEQSAERVRALDRSAETVSLDVTDREAVETLRQVKDWPRNVV